MIHIQRFMLAVALVAPPLVLCQRVYFGVVAVFAAGFTLALVVMDDARLRLLAQRCRPVLAGAAVILFLLLLQLAPISPPDITYPIWSNASAALGEDLGNRIGLDPGATLRTILNVAFLASVVLVASAMSTGRPEARRLYRATCIAISATCAICTVWRGGESAAWSDLIAGLAPMALIVATSLIVGASSLGTSALRQNWPDFLAAACALAVAISALVVLGDLRVVLAALAGALLVVLATRLPRLKAPPAGPVLVAVLATLSMAASVTSMPGLLQTISTRTGQISSALPRTTVEHLLSDTPLFGTGGGSFTSLAQIYNPEKGANLGPPTSFVKLYVEYGRAGWTLVAWLWLVVCFELAAGAFRRFRDRHICASAASILLVLAAQSLVSSPLSQPSIQLLAAMLIGMGLTQRESFVR